MGLFRRGHDVDRLAGLESRVATLERNQRDPRVPELEQSVEKCIRHVDAMRLDFESLYEKTRTTLSKLRKRADAPQTDEPERGNGAVARARRMLVERKLGRI